MLAQGVSLRSFQTLYTAPRLRTGTVTANEAIAYRQMRFNAELFQRIRILTILIATIGSDTVEGKKELVAVADGYRESEQSWRQLLLDCKQCGLVVDLKLATGDGALDFWKAMRQVYSKT